MNQNHYRQLTKEKLAFRALALPTVSDINAWECIGGSNVKIHILKLAPSTRSWRSYFLGSMCVLTSLFSGTSFAGNYTTTVSLIQWYHGLDCVFFTLAGIAEADPINPNSPWFAIPGTQTDYAQVYALLLSARMGGSAVTVGDGFEACAASK